MTEALAPPSGRVSRTITGDLVTQSARVAFDAPPCPDRGATLVPTWRELGHARNAAPGLFSEDA